MRLLRAAHRDLGTIAVAFVVLSLGCFLLGLYGAAIAAGLVSMLARVASTVGRWSAWHRARAAPGGTVVPAPDGENHP